MKKTLVHFSSLAAVLLAFQATPLLAADNAAEYESVVKVQFDKKGESGYAEEAAKRFKRKDTNKDGLVSFEEQYGIKLPE